MSAPPVLAPACGRPAAPARHPANRFVPQALSRFTVRRPASTGRTHPDTTTGGANI
jgi:hypothetical protein